MNQPAFKPFAPVLDYDHLEKILEEKTGQYRNAPSFPHIIIDDFFPQDVLQKTIQLFPDSVTQEQHGDITGAMDDGTVTQFRKNWLSMELKVDVFIRRLYWELNSAPFIDFVSRLTGIENLLPDPYFAGAGIHETAPGGLLMVHADYNKHPQLGLDRRCNIIIYLNEDWDESYGGHLEIWNREMTVCHERIAPVANRCVIFSTGKYSYHGHPDPLTCPPGRSRRSLAMYYYTNGRPEPESQQGHPTLFQKRPGKE